MRLFECQRCSNMVYFENDHCEKCQSVLGYLPDRSTISVVEPDGELWRAVADTGRLTQRFCANQKWGACNWLIADDTKGAFCAACRHNRTIPELDVDENLVRWRRVERAKHHLFYTLQQLHLPLANREDEPETGLAFDFLTDGGTAPKVMTGHDHGIITLNIAEADDAYREQLRTTMGEPYRTLLGHFRHEVGHYFWDVLVDRGGRLDEFRAVFGDERPDYDESLQHYYKVGPDPNWPQKFVSAYASAHPWEDFAETWAHYLHIVDTLEMAGAFGLRINPTIETAPELNARQTGVPVATAGIKALITAWVPVTLAVNGLNRCMGQPDLYPFVITDTVVSKLGFIHDLIHGRLKPKDRRA